MTNDPVEEFLAVMSEELNFIFKDDMELQKAIKEDVLILVALVRLYREQLNKAEAFLKSASAKFDNLEFAQQDGDKVEVSYLHWLRAMAVRDEIDMDYFKVPTAQEKAKEIIRE